MAVRARENVIGAWVFLIGVVLAVLTGIVTLVSSVQINPLIIGLLSLLGLIVGYFVAEKDVQTFLLASVSMVVVSFAGINGLVLSAAVGSIDIGRAITSILGALLFLFVPSTIVVVIKTVFSISKV